MHNLLRTAECVLFDFDGPVCRLFDAASAQRTANHMRELIHSRGEGSSLTAELRSTENAHTILHEIAAHRNGSFRSLLEQALTDAELRAAPSAWPTAYADGLIQTLSATGRKLAITTNNSSQAVELYLQSRKLGHLFAGHIHGRQPDTCRLKPDPDCLLRALDTTGTRADHALMIGDAPADVAAAQAAGVPFLGYARNAAKREQLHDAGARHIVGSLAEVLKIVQVTPLAPALPSSDGCVSATSEVPSQE